MGVFLFNIATDDLEVESTEGSSDSSSKDYVESSSTASETETITSNVVASTPVMERGEEHLPEVTPVRSRPTAATGRHFPPRGERAVARRIIYSSEDEEEVPEERSVKNAKWRIRPPRTFKYVDDNIQGDRLYMETASRVREGNQEIREQHAVACQNSFRRTIRKAEGKTAAVCISGAQLYKAKAHIITAGGERIDTRDSMRILEYDVSSRPGAHAHVEALCKRMIKKYSIFKK